jgi:anhydro-N-acetylmuramic acid kinase
MSGTSADAIDAALVAIDQGSIRFESGITCDYPASVRAAIIDLATDTRVDLAKLCQLEADISTAFAEATNALLNSVKLKNTDIRAIGSHGQTIMHQPIADPPFTLQLSNASLIAHQTQIDTVADFRRADIAAGGQGAPLVPAFHAEVFGTNPGKVILNLGGIANVTLLDDGDVLGFDTGPANTLLDAWCRLKMRLPYDQDGNWARSGMVNSALLDDLLTDEYFATRPPKSTGPDYFNLEWLHHRHSDVDGVPDEDVQATLTELTAITVAMAVSRAASQPPEQILVCGGGAKNRYLLERLSHHARCPTNLTSDLGVDCDYCEAIAFAWLAYRFLSRRPGNLVSVTGAGRPKILGGLFPAS